ncbi:MAG: FKBP-type peptidyl-prolyl cis-trans isomerase N-terminal domain-containing protein [Porphyromonadaceae bacterium]|nr:FKBP-type peptidyl-prolyl cis-trans isomerase N-terminal domain-containing protein [Porphyromonadaceae bacterium]
MKKIFLLGAVAIALASTSCNKGGNVDLNSPKTHEDSLEIALGVMSGMQTSQMFQMAAMQGVNIDSAEFMKGYEKGVEDTSKFSYYVGALQGIQLSKSLKEDSVNLKNVYAAFTKYMKAHGKDMAITDEQANQILQEHMMKKQEKEMRKQFGKNIELGEKYVAKYKKENPSAITTKSGLVYKVMEEGDGEAPTLQDTVMCDYVLYNIDGKEIEKNDDTKFPLTGVIKGWTEVLQLMKPGEKVEVIIPENLAYGSRGTYTIEPFSTLRFEMKLKKVLKAKPVDTKAQVEEVSKDIKNGDIKVSK